MLTVPLCHTGAGPLVIRKGQRVAVGQLKTADEVCTVTQWQNEQGVHDVQMVNEEAECPTECARAAW